MKNIKEKVARLFHKHNWVYYNYTPHGYGDDPQKWSTATSRKCSKCGEIEYPNIKPKEGYTAVFVI